MISFCILQTANGPQAGTTFLKVNLTLGMKNLKILVPFAPGYDISHFSSSGDHRVMRLEQFLLFSLFFFYIS